MTLAELRSISRTQMKENGIYSIIVFFFMAILISASILLNLLFDGLFVVSVLLIVLPTCFAFQIALVATREAGTFSFGLIINSYTRFFSNRFIGTYGLLGVLWKVIVIYFSTSFLSFIIINTSFYASNFMGFKDIITDLLSKPITVEAIDLACLNNPELYNIYLISNTLPSLVLSSISATYLLTRNSISFFLRISDIKGDGRYLGDLFKRTVMHNYKKVMKYYFALNWPMIILFIIGLVGGGYLGYTFNISSQYIFTFALAGALLLSFGLYGAKYFANKESIYTALLKEFDEIEMELAEDARKKIEELKRRQEEYRRMISSLRYTQNDLEDEQEEEEDE